MHDIGTQAPHEIWLAIPHRMLSHRLDKPALRVIRMSGPSLTEGIDRLKVNGVEVPVFNAAKTIVVSVASHATNFLFKGALLFKLWYDVPQRPTRDADLP